MTRRDYIHLARALMQTVEQYEVGDDKRQAVLLAARAIANECQLDNPRFNAGHCCLRTQSSEHLHHS